MINGRFSTRAQCRQFATAKSQPKIAVAAHTTDDSIRGTVLPAQYFLSWTMVQLVQEFLYDIASCMNNLPI